MTIRKKQISSGGSDSWYEKGIIPSGKFVENFLSVPIAVLVWVHYTTLLHLLTYCVPLDAILSINFVALIGLKIL